MKNEVNTTANTASLLESIFSLLGIEQKPTSSTEDTAPVANVPVKEQEKPETVKVELPDNVISCRYSDLLENVRFYPDGKAPSTDNAYFDKGSKNNYWFVSSRPVGYVADTGKVVTFRKVDDEVMRKMKMKVGYDEDKIVLQTCFDRFKFSVARKWALERDWIPEYRYTFADLEAEVGICVQQALVDNVDRTKITKMCFDRLDKCFQRIREHKTELREEFCNPAERYMWSMMFTGTTETLHRLVDNVGNEMPLPTDEDLWQFSDADIEQFKKVKVIFDRTRTRHSAASIETWLSAQCYSLNMPTKEAIKFIYGDRAVGKKKYRRCEVAYSRQANQVFTWLLEEVEIMVDEGVASGLNKWIKVLERSKAITSANKMLSIIKKYELMPLAEEGAEDGIKRMILVNPAKTAKMLKEVIAKACEAHDFDFFSEKEQEVVPATATASVEMPF